MSELNQAHVDIVVAGFADTKSDDDILESLYEAGVKFGDLRTTFNDIIKAKELRLSAKERKIKTNEYLSDWEPKDAEDMLAKVAGLQNLLKVATTKAMGALKAWAKDTKTELPKAPRKQVVRKVGFSGHYRKILDFALGNREATKEQIVKFCHDNEVPEAYATTAMNIIAFAKEWEAPETEASDVDVPEDSEDTEAAE